MKRFLLGGMLILVALGGLAAPVSAGVDNFTFKEFIGDYYLSRDDEGRARLRVVETFVAEFPEFNQNKGLYRAIPASYDGRSVDVQVESLTRGGQPEPIYDQRAENGYWVVETGDDNYVRGEQTYVLTYTIRDIVKDFGGHQEAYGDTVGTNWQQPFGREGWCRADRQAALHRPDGQRRLSDQLESPSDVRAVGATFVGEGELFRQSQRYDSDGHGRAREGFRRVPRGPFHADGGVCD